MVVIFIIYIFTWDIVLLYFGKFMVFGENSFFKLRDFITNEQMS